MLNNFNTTAKPFQGNCKADNHVSFMEAGPSSQFLSKHDKIDLQRALAESAKIKKFATKPILSLVLSMLTSTIAFANNDSFDFHFYGSPYTSIQMGVTDKPYDNFEGRKFMGRLAYGYLWNASSRLNYGLEGGVNVHENAHFYTATNAYPRSFSPGTLKKIGLDALAVLDFYASSKLDIFAKAGPAFVFEKFNYASPVGQPQKSHVDRGAIKYAYGAGYDITPKTNIFIVREMQTQRKNRELTESMVPISSTSIGIKHMFC